MDTQIQSQRRTDLPSVLEKRIELVRVNIAVFELDPIGVALENRIFRIPNIEALHDLCYRAGKVRQQVSRDGLVVTGQTGYGNVVDIRHRHSTGPQFNAWRKPRIVP